ncbi:MAG: cysteine--tRNA ligase [Candidatus Taylorbacteria bacterium]|nr:cysteine--tRNA ligase [Candidatus Taylorbacteria bacterium]
MKIYLHNTLTGKKEEFVPLKKSLFGRPKVGMYHCGPTVYNYPHIGNLRAYVFADSLKRLMKAAGYKVAQVINITDVGHLVSDADSGEDKMEKAKKREQKSAWDIAKFYTEAFFENLSDLNVDTEGTIFPRATDFIKEQIAIVRLLEKKSLTYRTSDGIYFDTSKFPDYGKLGHIDLSGIREGERIGVNEEKRNPTDFALWKFSPAGEKRDMEWESPWGKGFPGWHIECSAMSMRYLGETFDIHTGGIDHIPVHHQNEIAQSEGATGKQFVRYWMHVAFMNIAGAKMAKSEGNFLTLDVLKEKSFSPMDYRYFLLGARYSTPLSFTWEALEAARNAYRRLNGAVCKLPSGGKVDAAYWDKALSGLADDLDTPKALATIWEILRDDKLSPADKKATILKIDSLLGLAKADEAPVEEEKVPEAVSALAQEREVARRNKNWSRSDELRNEIAKLGYDVKDTSDGQRIMKR